MLQNARVTARTFSEGGGGGGWKITLSPPNQIRFKANCSQKAFEMCDKELQEYNIFFINKGKLFYLNILLCKEKVFHFFIEVIKSLGPQSETSAI